MTSATLTAPSTTAGYRPVSRRPGGEALDEMHAQVPLVAFVTLYLMERVKRSEITRRTATTQTNVLRSFAASYGDRPVRDMSYRAVQRWLEQNPEWKPSTRRMYWQTLRGFCRWLRVRGHIRKDPFDSEEMTRPKVPRSRPRPIDVVDVDLLLSTAPDTRGRLIVRLMYGPALRCVEVSLLRIEEIDWRHHSVIVHGKGGHEDEVPLLRAELGAIDDYLAEFPATSGPLVRSYTQPWLALHPHTIGGLVARWMHDAGVKRAAWDGRSAHALRHSAGTETLEATKDIRVAQELLRHVHLSSTEYYIGRAGSDRVRAARELRAQPRQEGIA